MEREYTDKEVAAINAEMKKIEELIVIKRFTEQSREQAEEAFAKVTLALVIGISGYFILLFSLMRLI